MKFKLSIDKYDVVYDMGGREVTDTAPLADLFKDKVEHFIYMSSAGVYKKSVLMPHFEVFWKSIVLLNYVFGRVILKI